uniref:Uncharacterized protein n=1 Tax=Cyclophora tenuis TaxID=216820 RepID=A0A7S1DE24_CYCTE|mmetsp:Transcript_8340/g.14264  ORF Transcript_8340/g.14264 Transcript_8340/m.14264 type:complete len:233 (+) Transcript_8340:124-822(+)
MYSPAGIIVFLGSILTGAVSTVTANISTLSTFPVCYDFPNGVQFTGRAEFVDTDGSGVGVLTVGDLSIATTLMPVGPFSQQGNFLRIDNANIQAVCTVVAAFSAPSCELEVEFKFTTSFAGTTNDPSTTRQNEGKFFARGTGPDPYAITGGVDDLFGAFGELDGTLTTSNLNPVTGDVDVTLSSTKIKFCVYPNLPPPTPPPPPPPPPTRAPISHVTVRPNYRPFTGPRGHN